MKSRYRNLVLGISPFLLSFLFGCGPVATIFEYGVYRSELPKVEKSKQIPLKAAISSKSDLKAVHTFDYKFTTRNYNNGKVKFHDGMETVHVGQLVNNSLAIGLERLFVCPSDFVEDEKNSIEVIFQIINIHADNKWHYSLSGRKGKGYVEIDVYDITAMLSVKYDCRDSDGELLSSGTVSETAQIKSTDLEPKFFARTFRKACARISSSIINRLKNSIKIHQYAQTVIQKRENPSNLVMKLFFSDRISLLPNSSIDAGETSKLNITITNKGNGTAFGVKLSVECKSKGITLPESIDVGDIQPGESRNLTIPIKADLSLGTGTASFLIKAHEKRGFDARPVELQVATAKLRSPNLLLASCNLNDSSGLGSGNGNNIPENNETIELDPYVRNQGEGDALKVKVKLSDVTGGIEVVKEEDELPSIAQGAMGRAALAFKVPRTFSGQEIRYTVIATDARGMSTEKTYTVPFKAKTPQLYYTYRVVDTRNREVPALKNGRSYNLKITPKNTGTNIAEGVKVKVTAGSDKIGIENYDGDVGKLLPGGAGTALTVPITLDRSFVASSLDLDVSMGQEGFPGFTRKITLPVMVEQPKLAYQVTLLNGVSDQAVSQNSWPRFRVSVSNNGNLDARDVKVKLSVSGGNITFDKPEIIGTIKAGESQYKDFTFFVRGDAPLGKMGVNVDITQADFDRLEETLAYTIIEEKAIVKRVNAIGGKQPAETVSYSGPPELYINSPNMDTKTYKEKIDFHGNIITFGRGNAIDRLSVTLNNKPLTIIPMREEIRLEANNITRREAEANKVILDGALKLQPGVNELRITCVDRNNQRAEKLLRISRKAKLGNIYAVLVGVSRFANPGYDLKYAASDAGKFSEFLRSSYGGNLSDNNLKVLTDTSATRAAIIGALTNFLGRATREDTVEIYLATHGVTGLDGMLYYLCYDTDMTNLAGTGFSDNDLTRVLNKNIKAGRIVIYLDACHSGLSGLSERYAKRSIGVYEVNDRINSLAAALSKAATTGVVCFSASSADGYSLEDPKWQGGIFTQTLIKGLEGDANKNQDEWVSVNELDNYLVTKVISVTGGKQRPRMNGTLVGDTPLSKVK